MLAFALSTSGLGEQIWLGVLQGVVLAVFCLGLVLLFGVMRVVNMAHGAFYMLGAMCVFAAAEWLHLGYFGGLVLTACAIGLLGVLLSRAVIAPIERRTPTRDARNTAVLMETMALSFIIYNGVSLTFGSFVRNVNSGLTGLYHVAGAGITGDDLLVVVGGAIAVVALHLFVTRTRVGKCMRAAAETEVGASLSGVNIRRMYDVGWFLGCACAALAGILIAPGTAADPTMGQDTLVFGFAVIVVAGLTSFTGVTVLAIVLSLLGALFNQFISTYYEVPFLFGVMIILLLVKPTGLFGGGGQTMTASDSAVG